MNIKKVDFDTLRDLIKKNATIKEITHSLKLNSSSDTKRFIFELSQIDKTFYEVTDYVLGQKPYINTKGQLVIPSDFVTSFATTNEIQITKDTNITAVSNDVDNSITIRFN